MNNLTLFNFTKRGISECDYEFNKKVTHPIARTVINLLPVMDKSVSVTFESDFKKVTIVGSIHVERIY